MRRDYDTMFYKNLVNEIARESGLYKCDVNKFLQAFTKVIGNNLKQGKKIYIKRFGVFFPTMAKSKTVNSIFTDGEMTVPEHMTYKFKFGEYFLDRLNDEAEKTSGR